MRSNRPSKPMKMTFLLFCVIILNDTRFFSTSFAVHCCLVWCVGVPQSFFTVHNECGTKILAPLKSKKNFQTSAEIPFEPRPLAQLNHTRTVNGITTEPLPFHETTCSDSSRVFTRNGFDYHFLFTQFALPDSNILLPNTLTLSSS